MNMKNGIADMLLPNHAINRAGSDEYFDADVPSTEVAFRYGAGQDQNYDGTAGAHNGNGVSFTAEGSTSQPAAHGTYNHPWPTGRGNTRG